MIVVVEDNPDDVELTLRAFRQHNLTNEIIVARDGAEGEELLFSGDPADPVPTLVLLDLKLPKLIGLQVLQALRSNPRTELVPAVILTSSIEEEDVISAYKLGADSYVRKPVDLAEFVMAIKQLRMYWLLVNRPPPAPGP